MTKLRHYDSLDTARFVTFSCYQRRNFLKSEQEMEIVARHLCHLRNDRKFKILGYVLMPNHIHLVVTPPADSRLGIEIGQMKARSAKEILALWRSTGQEIPEREATKIQNVGGTVLWHRRAYDHNCRSVDSVREKINYCHNNPVKRGLVNAPDEWKYSSYNWYAGERNVPVPIDDIEI